jgi:uncharacterized DUF497 family protein
MNKIFEWDPIKASANLRKHGISFDTATVAFTDPHAVIEFEDHYGDEDRWHTTGMVNGELLLLVVHTGWDDGEHETVRIISARRADKNERRNYEKNLRQIFN